VVAPSLPGFGFSTPLRETGWESARTARAFAELMSSQLAWIVEKFQSWTDPSAELPEEAVDRDQLLTNISIYWFTRSGISS
jgi:hypothetical protein